ncbi:pyridine nucleotide-disulphide oxidoreductase [Heterostelium album PN500]|uniref:NADH:ubiquinone reductase (non-electrogenic) n=1 Tax=Heterostelium pallidum (strain ATCC 26659 / Pp 5 / PN500) TaxID=670386 RepID=D3BKA7_HETP5|nr:pyridine nucleotide-disulphide oxidoreductase [Heterostelium album PN500]EFA78337.1 pyridine nucleotide-disulphide oxidoreductase [Heterostelium album PN500]|eukprot:XP_020430462.1 pyridine nucleotide-disulphide oxidoreductase [Heterostelium album PN500]
MFRVLNRSTLVGSRNLLLNQRSTTSSFISRNYCSTTTTTTENNNNNSNNNNENGNNNKNSQKKKKRGLLFWGGAAATAVASLTLLDLLVNDDLDIITDKFRHRLTKEEMKDRPNLVILGTGWASLCLLRKLYTDRYNVTIVSPRNYFLFTPLLPGTTTGTTESRSIMEPIRKYCRRSDADDVTFIEAECLQVDPVKKTVKCYDNSAVKGEVSEFELPYDQLVMGVGAESATFGIPGVKENACFLKEISDTRSIRDRMIDCFETAGYPGQPDAEIDRLLHFVIVGGGPTGVEFCAELNDFITNDVKKAFPKHLTDRCRVTLVEALPHILTVFDKNIIDHVEKKLQSSPTTKIWTQTAVTGVKEREMIVRDAEKKERSVPYGMLVWATGNAPRPVTQKLIQSIGPEVQNVRRGLVVDEYFRVKGADGIWAIGDCSVTPLAPTAQVASQQGRYLGRLFNDISEDLHQKKQGQMNDQEFTADLKKKPLFKYRHMGTLAYVGDKSAVFQIKDADNKTTTSEGLATFLLWRSAYLSKCLSIRNRVLVAFDWTKASIFGRDVSRG